MFAKYKILVLILLCFSARSFAENLPYYDEKPFHFGFSVGTNLAHYDVSPSMETQLDGNSYQVRTTGLIPGFSVGGILDLRVSNNFNLRCSPTFYFVQQTLSYKNVKTPDGAPAEFTHDVTALPIAVPLHLKFSANRVSEYRPYIIAGGGFSFDVGRDKEKPVLLQTMDAFVEWGFGCDLYFPFFKLAPELKFALGYNNLIVPMSSRPDFEINDEKKYTQAIDKLFSRMVTLTFNFE